MFWSIKKPSSLGAACFPWQVPWAAAVLSLQRALQQNRYGNSRSSCLKDPDSRHFTSYVNPTDGGFFPFVVWALHLMKQHMGKVTGSSLWVVIPQDCLVSFCQSRKSLFQISRTEQSSRFCKKQWQPWRSIVGEGRTGLYPQRTSWDVWRHLWLSGLVWVLTSGGWRLGCWT